MKPRSPIPVSSLAWLLATGCGGAGGTAGSLPDGGPSDARADRSPRSDGGAVDAPADAGGPRCTGEGGGLAYSKYKWALAGNLHQHTANSIDAYSFGTRATPADAYEFAKGRASIAVGAGSSAAPGPTVKIDRPLDFLAITDHSEWLGVLAACLDVTSSVYDSKTCKLVRSTSPTREDLVFADLLDIKKQVCSGAANGAQCIAEQKTAWEDEQTAAAHAYDRCHFTSLVAYEWTSMNGKDTNHRNVFFGSATVPANPLDSFAFTTTAQLFSGLDAQCTGDCSALVVPHNSNMSAGTSLVLPTSASELAGMQKYQRLVEIYQHKGSSECFYDPASGGGDPACAFEYLSPGASGDTPSSYVRTALESGMSYAIDHASGNPMQLGIIGSTDDHDGTAGFAQESTFAGHAGRTDDTAASRLKGLPQYGSGGLAFVWAEENTREAIFAALMRRETFATSGPRITVRFYETSATAPCTADFPRTLIDEGAALPMGGTFHASDVAGGSPVFAVAAWPDAFPQPLADGSMNVAGIAEAQVIKAHGKAGGSGSPVVVEDAPVRVAIPAVGGCVAWRDPSFDASEHAFYYVRVLQVPTWRWSHFDCQAQPTATGCGPGGTLDVTIQERAWTSPIWFEP